MILERRPCVVESGSGRTGRVGTVAGFGQHLRRTPAFRIALFVDLVADRPQNNARMVAVTADHVDDILCSVFAVVFRVTVGDLRKVPFVKEFVHDHKTEFVTKGEQFRRRRIVAGTDGVHAHFAHETELTAESRNVDRRTERTEVVVVADPVELDVTAVEEEPVICGEFDGACAELHGGVVERVVVFVEKGDVCGVP